MRRYSGGRLRRLGVLVLAGAALLAPCAAQSDDTDDRDDKNDEKPASAGATTPAEAAPQTLTADSGVAVQTVCTNCNNADLSLGALGNDHVAVICDGQPIPSGLAQIYLFSIVPSTMLDRITVNKGACRAEYEGSAVGGGLEVARRAIKPGLQVNAATDIGDFGWRGNKLDLTGKKGKAGGYFVWTTARSDKIDPNGDGFANLAQFDRTTYEAGVEFEPSRNQRLRVSTARYEESQRDGQAGYSLAFGAYNLENVELDRVQYDAVYEWSSPGGSTLSIASGWAGRSENIDETEIPYPFSFCQNLLDPLGSFDTACPSYLIDDTRSHGAISWSRPIGTQAKISAGVSRGESDYDVIDVKYNSFSPVMPIDFQLQEAISEDGLWVEGQTALGSQVELVGGARFVKYEYDDNEAELVQFKPQRAVWLDIPLPEGNRVLPRAALTWKPSDALNLRLSVGTGFRAPTPAFSEVCCGRRYRGNRGLELESSVSYGYEVTYQPSPRLKLGGSAFMTDFDDLIVHMISLASGANTYQYVNVPDARKTSLTVDGRFDGPAWLTTRASYSWLEAENTTSGDNIPVLLDLGDVPIPTALFYPLIPTSVDGRGALGLDFRLPRSIGLAVNAQYTGTSHVQFLGAPPDLFASTLDRGSLIDRDSFWAVNLGLRKALKTGLELFAGVDNLFDEIQTDLGDPDFDTNWGLLRGRYVYGGMGYHFDKKK